MNRHHRVSPGIPFQLFHLPPGKIGLKKVHFELSPRLRKPGRPSSDVGGTVEIRLVSKRQRRWLFYCQGAWWRKRGTSVTISEPFAGFRACCSGQSGSTAADPRTVPVPPKIVRTGRPSSRNTPPSSLVRVSFWASAVSANSPSTEKSVGAPRGIRTPSQAIMSRLLRR